MTRFILPRAAVAAFFCLLSISALHGVPAVSSTKVDSLSTDVDADGKADPGDVIKYNIKISNTGADAGTGVSLADPTPTNTTLVAGSVHASPVGFDDSYTAVGNTKLYVGTTVPAGEPAVSRPAAEGLLANDTTVTDSIAVLSNTAPSHGTVIVNADGTFTYTPTLGYVGADSFTYIIKNSVDATLVDTPTTVNITVSNRVWYLKNGASGNGSSSTPSGNPAAISTSADAATDIIYVFHDAATLNGAFTLDNSQKLQGQGVSLVVNSITLLTAGATPTIANNAGNAITLGQGNSLAGFNIGTTSGTAIFGANVGTLGINGVSVSTTGAGLNLTGTSTPTVNIALGGLISSGGARNVNLVGLNGTISLGGGALSGATNNAFDVSGAGNAVITYSGTIANTAARAVNVTGKNGGSLSLSGLVTSSGSGTGISLTSNTGATISFTGGLSLSTGTSAAFTATGGGTVTATQDNTGIINIITTTTGTGLNVAGTTIGAAGLTFRSISSNGAVNGILLNNTGAIAGLTVTGNGSAGTGGTIQNTTADGVYLNSTINPSLSFMNINDSADSGIFVDAVSGLSLTSLFLDSNGAQAEGGVIQDSGIHIEDLIGASNTILNCTIQDSRNTNLDWDPNFSSGLSTLTVTGTNLNHAGEGVPTQGNAGINLVATGSANVKLVVSGGQIINNAAAGILVTGGSGTTVATDIESVDMKSSAPPVDASGASWGNGVGTNFGINLTSTGTAIQRHKINNVQLAYTGIAPNDGGAASAIGFIPSGTGTFDLTLTNNTIGLVGVPRSGNENFFGIAGDLQDSPTNRINVSNNTIRNTALNGIFIQSRDPSALAGNSTTDLTVRNNTVGSISDDDDFSFGAGPDQAETHAIRIDSRNDSVLRVDIAGNSADGLGGNQDYLVRQRDTSTFALERLVTNTNAVATVQTFITGQNPTPVGQTARATVATTFTAIADNSVQNPSAPLLFAPVEPEATRFGAPDSVNSAIAWTESVKAESSAASPAPEMSLPQASAGNVPSGAATTLTQTQLDSQVSAARARWKASGLSDAQLATLDKVTFEVADLPGWYLGEAAGQAIRVDNNAGGNGWFIDTTPMEDGEFEENPESEIRHAALGRVDLLTTILHEMGHSLGLCDTYSKDQRGGVMYGFLTKGERRLPKTGEANNAVPHEHASPHFLSTPITIGTLPPGKSVTIVYQTAVDAPLPLGTFEITSQGTVSGGNFANVLTDDPSVGGGSDPTVTPVDRPDTTVGSINRVNATPTSLGSVSWTVTFADPIISLTASNFSLVAGGGLGVSPAITAVTPTGTPATVWTVTASTGSGDGSLGLNLVNDAALSHDVTNLTFNGAVYTLDRTPPVVTSVSSSTADGTYKTGDTVSIQINFSEAVDVTGTPQLTLETGTTDRVVNYASGSGTNTLTFTYTVQAGDTSADLDYQSTNALSLNGGTIKDVVGNNATLTLSSPGAAGSLGANKAIVIDSTPPVVTNVTANTANGSYNESDTINVQVVFSETVSVTGAPQLTLETGAADRVANYAGGSGSNTLTFIYIVQGGDTSADLDYQSTGALALNGGTVRDVAGNDSTLTLAAPGAAGSLGANKAIVIDTTAPTVVMTSATGNPAINAAIPVTAQFSETVTGFTAAGITAGNATVGNFIAVDGDTYTFDLTPSGPSVTVTADIAAATAQDTAGNDNTAAAQFSRTIVDAVSVATINAGDNDADESGNTGTYTFTRGSTTGALTAGFKFDSSPSSSASATDDFTLSGVNSFNKSTGEGTVTFLDGQDSVTVTLTGLLEVPNAAELEESVRLDVVAQAGYAVGTSDHATVTIAANGFVVTKTDDSGEGSLRQAITNANNIADPDTITFEGSTFTDGTIPDIIDLASQLPAITSEVTITGTGADKLTLRRPAAASFNYRILAVNAGGVVSLSGLTITGGRVVGFNGSGGGFGGGISNKGSLTVTRCALSGNSASGGNYGNGGFEGGYGGGIYNHGSLTVTQCSFSGNSASGGTGGIGGIGHGGAIFNFDGTLTVTQCALSGNSASGGYGYGEVDGIGGGIYNNLGTLILTQSTLSGNSASGGDGSNSGDGIGGGIYNYTGALAVTQCTLSGNSASGGLGSFGGKGGNGNGGGIYNVSGILTVSQSTLSGNSGNSGSGNGVNGPGPDGDGNGGGIYNVSGTFNSRNSILAGNTATSNGMDVIGSVTDGGGNLVGITDGGTGFAVSPLHGSSATPVDPLLGPLADNGGPTLTHSLLPGSPAINAGDDAGIPEDEFDLDGDGDFHDPIPFDQRGTGFIRTIGKVDIGAFEVQKSVSIVANAASTAEGSGSGTTDFTFKVSRTGDTTDPVAVHYAVSGTGVDQADFGGSLPSGTVTIPAGSADTTLTIPVSKDSLYEADESFTVTLSNPDPGYSLSTATANSTIVNDDTATTLASSATPCVTGQSVTFTATVDAGVGTATGTVTFKDGATALGTATLVGGQATLTITNLSVGSHDITANYSGDATFGGSVSSALTQVVNAADSTTTLATTPNPTVFGQSVTLAATVAVVDPGTGVPTGLVFFLDGSTTLVGTGTVNSSGVASLVTSALGAGSHQLTAVYRGDGNYLSSACAAVGQTVNPAGTNIALVSNTNPAITGQVVTFTATVTTVAPGGGMPTGMVTFKDGATLLGSVALNGSGQASFSTGTLGTGGHTITAVYAGDANFQPSISSDLSQMVDQASTTTALTTSGSPSEPGESVTFTATVGVTAPGAGSVTGTVTFKDAGSPLGTVPLNASGVAAFSTNALATGSHDISAVYGGDANFNGSTSGNVTQIVGPKGIMVNSGNNQSATVNTAYASPLKVRVVDAADNPLTGVTVTFTPPVSGAGGAFTGGNTAITNGSGIATAPAFTANTTPGSYIVAATVAGGAGSATFTLTNTSGSATHFLVTAPASSTAGVALSYTVTAKDEFENTATGYNGTVHFTGTDSAATLPADCTLTNGAGTFSATLKTAGNQTIFATDTASPAVTGTSGKIVVISAAATRFAVSSPPATTAGVAFNITVTARDSFGNVATAYDGSVHFTNTDSAAMPLADSTLTNGVRTFSATLKTAGNRTITATDTGSPSITGTSGNILVKPAAATHFVVTAPAGATAGIPVNVSVTARDSFNNTVLSYPGTVHLSSTDEAAILPVNSTLTAGVGSFGVNFSTGGNQTVTATDTVSGSITGSSSGINVTSQADLAVTITGSPDTVNALGNITYAIRLTNNGPSPSASPSLSLPLPAGTTFVSATAPGGWTTSAPAVGVKGTVSFGGVSLASGGVANFTVVAKADANVSNDSILAAVATGSSSTTDPNSGNNSAKATAKAKSGADLQLALSDSSDPVVAGTDLTYTIKVANKGPIGAENVSITDVLPAGTTFVSLAVPSGWSATTPAVGASGTVTITRPLFANSGSATFTLKTKVAPDVANGASLGNTATVSSATVDIVPANNSATAVTAVTTQSDLAVSITGTPATAPKGSDVTYQIKLSNKGPSHAAAPKVSLPIPSQMTFVSVTAPAGWTAAKPVVGSGGTVVFSAGSLANGATANFTVVAKVKFTASAGASLKAIATAIPTVGDLVQANNHASAISSVGTVKATVSQPVTTGLVVNSQTGLFDVIIKVTNTTPLTLNGFRLRVNCGAYKEAYPSLRLKHVKGPSKISGNYIDYPDTVAVGETVRLKLSFYTRTRTFPSPFKPVLKIKPLPSTQAALAPIAAP